MNYELNLCNLVVYFIEVAEGTGATAVSHE